MQAAGLMLGVEFGGGRSLANAAKQFLGLEVPKDLQTSDWAAITLSAGQIAYAATDAILAWRLWSLLTDQLCRAGRWAAYELQRSAIPAVVSMELRGLGIDLVEHARQSQVWAAELAEARREYQALTGDAPPSKPAEVQAWLARVLDADRLVSWPRTANGQLSIKDTHLKQLIHIPSCRPVLAMLGKAKLISTFGPKLAAMVSPVTGRLHASFNIGGTKAGRFSCTRPNLQQLPAAKAPEFKRCIVPSPGNLLVGCDWSQVELRAAAWISGDVALTQLYADGRDLHTENAALIAGVALQDVTKEQRQGARAVSFGALYGMQAPGLVEYAFDAYGVHVSIQEAEHALESFFRNYPQLDRWRWDNWRECQGRQKVHIGVGRVVEAAWEFGQHLRFTQCCNLPIQGICADAMLHAISLVHGRLRRRCISGGLIATVHDELLLEVAVKDAEQARDILHTAMVDAFEATFPGAPTTNLAEAKIGGTWADLK
jgi:DNA polymerase-1